MADPVSVVLVAVVTIAPFYLALFFSKLEVIRKRAEAVIAFALGMTLLFFLEPMHGTNGLGLYSPTFGPPELVLVVAFVLSFLILGSTGSKGKDFSLWIITTGIALHSFSESSELVGATPIYLRSLSVAFPNAASFVLHKFLEGFVLVAYSAAVGTPSFRQLVVGATPMALIGFAGVLSTLLPPVELTPFIAAGAGGWALVLVALSSRFDGKKGPSLIALVALGFIVVYSVGLLHSSQIG